MLHHKMGNYRLSEIGQWLGGRFFKSDQDDLVSELLYDSRRLYHPEHSLFIALKSSRNNGHHFIPTLIEQGVHNFLVQEMPEAKFTERANFLLVEDTLSALQQIAEIHRRNMDCQILAITGSNGKTIVKEWLYHLLSPYVSLIRSPKSFNSQIGVPLSVWQINKDHRLGIIEAGISLPGEMGPLEKIIKPDLGIFTNIGSAHLEFFQNKDALVKEKAGLFKGVKQLIYCRDHSSIHQIISDAKIPCTSWGDNEASDYQIVQKEIQQSHVIIRLKKAEEIFPFQLPFSDPASIENALHCIVFCLEWGMHAETIQDGLNQLHRIEMRLEMSKGIHQCSIINDSYSADRESLKIALDYMMQQIQFTRRTVILSDFQGSDADPAHLYREISAMLIQKNITRLIGVGEILQTYFDDFKGEKLFYRTTSDLLVSLPRIVFRNECILLKGARLFAFERIADALQEKSHETILEVNLTSMLSNLNYYRSQLPQGVKTMAMVKAFSYGSGTAEIAGLLQNNRVDYLAVAYADEGIELRKAGITMPIMVMSPETSSFQAMISEALEPEIYSFRVLDLFSAAAEDASGYNGKPIRFHIKLDTGMHRLGFTEEDIPGLIKRIKQMPWLEPASVFSHLVASGESEHDAFTREQIGKFELWTTIIQQGIGKPLIRHILNSAGISRHPTGVFDMVRLGIGLYGIGSGHEQQQLLPVSRLKTRISQIKELIPGDTVGYSRKGKIMAHSRIATLPIGYADGFLRKLGNGNASILVHGKEAHTIGNICMDMCNVDVTNIPEAREGDEVIVFESANDIFRLSAQLETIPYELLTGISGRVKRIYFQE